MKAATARTEQTKSLYYPQVYANVDNAAGVLFTVAGQNAIESIYPNLSLFYYWSQRGNVLMR